MTVIDFSNAFKNVLSQIKNTQKKKEKEKKNSFTAFSNTSIFSSPYIFLGIVGV